MSKPVGAEKDPTTDAEKSKRARYVPREVGRLMAKWRKASGKSMEKVGAEIGCTKGHISQVEAGKGNMSLPMFLDYCRAIHAPASRVLEEPMLQKQKDVDRLAEDLVQKAGLPAIQMLAGMDRQTLRKALEQAEQVAVYEATRRAARPSSKPSKRRG